MVAGAGSAGEEEDPVLIAGGDADARAPPGGPGGDAEGRIAACLHPGEDFFWGGEGEGCHSSWDGGGGGEREGGREEEDLWHTARGYSEGGEEETAIAKKPPAGARGGWVTVHLAVGGGDDLAAGAPLCPSFDVKFADGTDGDLHPTSHCGGEVLSPVGGEAEALSSALTALGIISGVRAKSPTSPHCRRASWWWEEAEAARRLRSCCRCSSARR